MEDDLRGSLRQLEDRLEGGASAADAIAFFVGILGENAVRNRTRHLDEMAEDASRHIGDWSTFPIEGVEPITMVSLVRHLGALSHFTAEELDNVFGQARGTTNALMEGTEPVVYDYGDGLTDFLTFSRMVALTFPGQSVRAWWERPRHGKRKAPLDLAREGRLREKIFAPYAQELHCNGKVVSELLPIATHPGCFVEMSLALR